MQNYRRRLEEHLLPTFEKKQLLEISRDTIAAWERVGRKAGYAAGSLRSWRSLLHLILADAVEDGLLVVNPAAGPGQAGRPIAASGGGEDHHDRARHPADRRAGRVAVRPRRRVRGRGDDGLHRHPLG
jgi:hypothetical protein